MTMVREESMEVDTSVQRKSTDTKGSSLTARMPFMGPAAAWRKASLTCRRGAGLRPRPLAIRAVQCSCRCRRAAPGVRGWVGPPGAGCRLCTGIYRVTAHLLGKGLLLHLEDQVHNGHVWCGHSESDACMHGPAQAPSRRLTGLCAARRCSGVLLGGSSTSQLASSVLDAPAPAAWSLPSGAAAAPAVRAGCEPAKG